MIIELLIKKLDKKISEEDLLFGLLGGLLWGLFAGLFAGLSAGLFAGLLLGLLWGLFAGLFAGLSAGLFVGLGSILGVGLASLINHYPNLLPIWILIIVVLVILEVYFWLDKSKPKNKKNIIWFTVGKKFEALIESLVTLGVLNLIRISYEKLKTIFIDWNEILKWVGYIGIGLITLIVVIGVLWLYVKINSLKYNKVRR